MTVNHQAVGSNPAIPALSRQPINNSNMTTSKNITVAETQLKARRTSLGKKSKEDLINIVLRKDKTERESLDKIMVLKEALVEANTKLADSQRSYKKLEENYKVNADRVQVEIEKNDKLLEKLKAEEKDCVGLINGNLLLIRQREVLRKCLFVTTAALVAMIIAVIVL